MRIEKRTFQVGALSVDEIIFYENESSYPAGHSKNLIAWGRTPIEETIVSGLPNPCTFARFPCNNVCKDLEEARQTVERSFQEYYHLGR